MIANWITIEKFSQVTGYTPDAIRQKISRGQWTRGQEYTKAPDGRILINVEGYHTWVETSIQESESPAIRPLKSTSTIEASVAASASPLSPPPLT